MNQGLRPNLTRRKPDDLHTCSCCGLWGFCSPMGTWMGSASTVEESCQTPSAGSCALCREFLLIPMSLDFVLTSSSGSIPNRLLFSEKDPRFAALLLTYSTRPLRLPPSFKSSTSPSCLFLGPTRPSAKSHPIQLSHLLTRRQSMTPPRPRCSFPAPTVEHSG